MKRPSQTPAVAVERYSEANTPGANCSAMKISSTDPYCVVGDPDSTPGMITLAGLGYFLGEACPWGTPELQPDDGLCINTAVNLAFTS